MCGIFSNFYFIISNYRMAELYYKFTMIILFFILEC